MENELKLIVNVSSIKKYGNDGGMMVKIKEKNTKTDDLCDMKLFFKQNDVDFDFGLYELTLKKI